ncbi:hypothetical protein [Acidiphilium sp. C61]|uniref:hypothetical protein n=1 Tax=Acidiphilium sp. C61 TaxID=1671485 RepID=UPI00157B550E|nr:hypothetical protein [Acidiphilium sp. C61]
MNHTRLSLHAAALLMSCTSAFAGAPTPKTNKFIFADAGSGWRFMLGPGKSPHAMLWLYRGHPKARMTSPAISIVCQRATGQQAILIATPDQPAIPPGRVSAMISVGRVSHSIGLVVGHRAGVMTLTSSGTAPGAIARAMGALPVGQQDALRVSVPGLRTISMPVADIREDATMASEICGAWTSDASRRSGPLISKP